MLWFHYASSFLAISQLLFMGLFYLLYHRRQLLGSLVALFNLCLIAYILSRMPDVNSSAATGFILSLLAITAPAVLWVIAHYLFDDDPKVHPGIWILIAGYISLRAIGILIYDPVTSFHPLWYALLFYLPQIIMLGLACHVVYTAFKGLGADLVEPRRRLRVPFAIGMGSIVGVIVASGFLLLNNSLLDGIYFFTIFVFILSINLTTFRLHKDSPQLIVDTDQLLPLPPVKVSAKDIDRPLVDRVNKAMESERLYAQSGLTIGDLADKVSMQEYRLRRLINQKLHYRNFNQYLNQYRIAEAARRLQDPAENGVAISSIALDVGYASLSSFNKAFKELHGVTPTIFRTRSNK
jgi:AraC-like DNA-binding protein